MFSTILQIGAAAAGAFAAGMVLSKVVNREAQAHLFRTGIRTGIQSTSFWDPRYYDGPSETTLLEDEIAGQRLYGIDGSGW